MTGLSVGWRMQPQPRSPRTKAPTCRLNSTSTPLCSNGAVRPHGPYRSDRTNLRADSPRVLVGGPCSAMLLCRNQIAPSAARATSNADCTACSETAAFLSRWVMTHQLLGNDTHRDPYGAASVPPRCRIHGLSRVAYTPWICTYGSACRRHLKVSSRTRPYDSKAR